MRPLILTIALLKEEIDTVVILISVLDVNLVPYTTQLSSMLQAQQVYKTVRLGYVCKQASCLIMLQSHIQSDQSSALMLVEQHASRDGQEITEFYVKRPCILADHISSTSRIMHGVIRRQR